MACPVLMVCMDRLERRVTEVCNVVSHPFCHVKPISPLRFDYDTTTIRRYHDAFEYDESDRNYDMRLIRL